MVGLQLSGEVELNLSLNSFSCPSYLVLRELDWPSCQHEVEQKRNS